MAPASRGGSLGEVVDIDGNLISVVLDKDNGMGALDFPRSSCRREDA